MLQRRIFRVLLVEDSPSEVRLLETLLADQPWPCRLQIARDGEEALHALHGAAGAARPDLVILDLNLPKLSGHQVLVRIKSDPALRTVPVIVLSSSLDHNDVVQAYDEQAACFIQKPQELDDYQRIVSVIERFWMGTVTLPAA